MAAVATGSTPPTRNPANYGDEFLFVSPGDLGENMFVLDTAKKLSRTGFALSRRFPKGSILFTCIGSTIGKCGIASIELSSNQQINAVLPSPGFSTDYIYYSLCALAPTIRASAGEQAVPIVNKSQFCQTLLPFPPLCEQRAIAAALSDVDAVIGALEKLIAKKRDLKQAAMQQLLTGRQRLPGFDGKWEEKKLGDVAPLQRGFDLPTAQLKPGGYPVVYSNGVLNHHADFKVKAPGVVTGRSGTIGKVTFVEQHYWPHNTSLWVTNFKGNAPKFIFYLYGMIGFERFGTGSGVPTLNRNDVHAFSIRIPPSSEEQRAIAAVLSDMDAEIGALQGRRDKTRALKQGMMQELLTGRIRLPMPAEEEVAATP
jgi:type I restriction enzyme S subunit